MQILTRGSFKKYISGKRKMIQKRRFEMQQEKISKENVIKYWLNTTIKQKGTETEPKYWTNVAFHLGGREQKWKHSKGPVLIRRLKILINFKHLKIFILKVPGSTMKRRETKCTTSKPLERERKREREWGENLNQFQVMLERKKNLEKVEQTEMQNKWERKIQICH